MSVIDLFAGPGGWDIGARLMGIDPIGLEWDPAACATRRAAGLRTMECNVAAVDFKAGWLGARWRGLIASPPCQAFSMAGDGAGRAAIDAYLHAIEIMGGGRPMPTRWLDEKCHDDRAHLVLEPLRWALALKPRWVVCEQVMPVLPLWEAMATVLQQHGYSTSTGILSAEQYGVPQTRRRAILVASLDREARLPAASHQRYIAPRKDNEVSESLFELASPERIVHPDDRALLPWISMAEALGWGMTARPYPVLASGRSTGGPDKEKVGGSAPRSAIYEEQAAGRWVVKTGNFTAIARDADGERSKAGSVPYEREVDAPAPTIDTSTGSWKVTYNSRSQRDSRGDEPVFARQREIDEPAPTIAGQSRNDTWAFERPATTLQGDPRVFHPGGHIANDGRNNDLMVGRSEAPVRVSIEEALVLQSFPADYPVQGTKTKQFEQVGNAVPPLMARAILEVVA